VKGELGHNARQKNENVIPSKLQTRAWTFQERLLAPRVLHFTEAEMTWECVMQYRCECQLQPKIVVENESFKMQFQRNIRPTKDPVYSNPKYTGVHFSWKDVVKEFTQRKLTFDSDRLPAISGLAELMKSDAASDYACGLWKQDLALHLLWWVNPFAKPMMPSTSRRHSTYYAPSWSWASVTGPIRYHAPLVLNDPNVRIGIEIIEVDTLPAGPNPFGQVRSGHINVRGLLAPVKVCMISQGMDAAHPYGHLVRVLSHYDNPLGDPYNIPFGDICLDVKGDGSEEYLRDSGFSKPAGRDFRFEVHLGDDLFLLMVMQILPASNDEVYFVVLRTAKNNPTAYERVGYLGGPQTQSWDRWAANASEEEITII
jgi:hypothetical protein